MTKYNVNPEIKKLESIKVSLTKKYATEPINKIAFALVTVDLVIRDLESLDG